MDINVIMMTVAAVLILVSAVLLFVTSFFGKGNKKETKLKEKAFEAVTDFSDGEFRLMLGKYLKETERAQKEQVDVLKKQTTLLQTQIENLEHEIYMLSEKQANQTKTIIKFNKENARQLAINERETLEYVMTELKKAIEKNTGAVEVTAEEEAPFIEAPLFDAEGAEPVLQEVSETELLKVTDLPSDEEFVVPDLPDPDEIPDRLEESPAEETFAEEIIAEETMAEEFVSEEPSLEDLISSDIPEIPDDLDLSALFEDIAEAAAEESMTEEPAPEKEEKAQAADSTADIGADPNAMMTPEDIAKLLEAMGQ